VWESAPFGPHPSASGVCYTASKCDLWGGGDAAAGMGGDVMPKTRGGGGPWPRSRMVRLRVHGVGWLKFLQKNLKEFRKLLFYNKLKYRSLISHGRFANFRIPYMCRARANERLDSNSPTDMYSDRAKTLRDLCRFFNGTVKKDIF
jgi:hypothetical protein